MMTKKIFGIFFFIVFSSKCHGNDYDVRLKKNGSHVLLEASDKLLYLLSNISDSLETPESLTLSSPNRDGNSDNYPIEDYNEIRRLLRSQEQKLSLLERKMTERCDVLVKTMEVTFRNELKALNDRIRFLELGFNEPYEGTSLNRKPRNYVGGGYKIGTEDSDKTVAFDAYRNKPFHREQSYISFDGATLNAGGGLDIDTGIFTAPVGGIYLFSFHALTQDGRATYVKIVHNGRNVGGAYRRHEGEVNEKHVLHEELGLRRAEGMLGQTLLLSLKKGDEVGVFAYHGNLRDGGWHYTHFMGFRIH